MDLVRRSGLRVAAAAVVLLFTLGTLDQVKTPALPMSERAAVSIEEMAERLRRHLDDDPTYAAFVTSPDTPLFPWCWPENVETRMPPAGVPAYSGRLLLPDMDEPLAVRFWITSSQAAVRAVAEARRGTGECSGEDALKSVIDFDRWGWHGMQALTTTENWTETATPAPGARSWPRVAGCWRR
ncbi:MAG: hypothetical protein HOW59_24110 [Nonomuraea sp.]|nr:hypothetical protein [Nonomuraea sp.]